MQTEEIIEQDKKQEIIDSYKNIVVEKKSVPVYSDFIPYDITRGKIRAHFGGIELLYQHVRENFPEFLDEHFSSVEHLFSPERQINENSTQGTYVITTAVADSPADVNFLNSLKSFCKKNSAKLVIIPCESVTNSFENKTASFDPYFNDTSLYILSEDTQLNENFSLCSIQVSAKQIKSITGLSRLGNREGSYVFASPKQFLEYVPSGNSRGKNYAIMTPGACTKPAYYTETFVSKRLSYIAEKDHTMGAIIVDILDEKKFDFRQIQADETGCFNDMGIQYSPDGKTKKVPVNVIFGDIHGVYVDHDALDYFTSKFSKLNVSQIFLHDVFDGHSISHHIKDIAKKAKRSNSEDDCLEQELKYTFDVIESIDKKLKPFMVNIVKSNHDEFLDRYLSAGNYVHDPKNHYLSLKIAPALFEGIDVLARGFEITKCPVPSHWNFLNREISMKIGDVECASHGDLGMNGAKPSLNSLERIYGSCVVGHNHSAAIQRNVFRVGTLSKLNMEYNRGPSSWTQTCCILYENGQRQLINYIE